MIYSVLYASERLGLSSLNEFKSAGLIEIGRKRIKIVDLVGLQEMVGS